MSKTISILFLTANPQDTSSLRLDEEIRGIDLALQQTEFRDKFDIKQHRAVRATDLQGYLLRHKPDIVHFSGHGSTSSQIILEDNHGNSHPVSPRALSEVFSVLKDNIRCVVLNACYSEKQAQAIAQHISCVLGMSKAIGDAAAISFAIAFYQALGYGRNMKTAFDLGCAQIDLDNLDEQDTPKLLAINSNPENIHIIEDAFIDNQFLQGTLDTSIVVMEQNQLPSTQEKVTNQMYKLIMVIDDSIATRKMIETALRREGYRVKSFSDGVEAMRWLESSQEYVPDLIFLDIGLPRLDGYEVARRLKRKPQLKKTVIVMISSRHGVMSRLIGRLVGAKGYVTKPFRMQTIIFMTHLHIDLPNLD